MFRIAVFALLVFSVGCQSAREKNMEFIGERNAKLMPLTRFKPTWCNVESHLTQPALASYRQTFSEEAAGFNDGVLAYTWKARKYGCEITPLNPTPAAKNHQGFLESALCVLLQSHWVNSPFEELQVVPRDIEMENDGRLRIGTSLLDKSLGIYLDSQTFKMETHTKANGVLKATYVERGKGEWLPSALEQDKAGVRFVVDDIEYDGVKTGGRRLIKSFWISVGKDDLRRHTQLVFNNCQNF